jgi:hypothetical protein
MSVCEREWIDIWLRGVVLPCFVAKHPQHIEFPLKWLDLIEGQVGWVSVGENDQMIYLRRKFKTNCATWFCLSALARYWAPSSSISLRRRLSFISVYDEHR